MSATTLPVGPGPATAVTLVPPLARVPVPVFGVPMGVLGVGLAWGMLHHLLGVPRLVPDAILLLGAALAAGAFLLYGAKAVRHPRTALADWQGPAAPFLAQVPITLLLLSEAAEDRWPSASSSLAVAGAALAAVLAAALLARWLAGDRVPAGVAHPGWAVPGIALLFAAALLPRHGWSTAAPAVAGAALGWCVLVMPAVAVRLASGPLPAGALPLPAILVALPSVGLLAASSLLPTDAQEPVATLLVGAAALVAVGAAARLPRLLREAPMGLPWWAYGMPSAALAIALLAWGEGAGGNLVLVPGVVVTIAATSGVVILLARTVAAAWRNAPLLPP